MDRDETYRQHIIEAIKEIEIFLAKKGFDDLTNDRLLRAGVLHELLIIGEAAKRLSTKFKSQYNLPWEDIAGARDKIVHDYFKVNLKVVWDTVRNDLPKLKAALTKK